MNEQPPKVESPDLPPPVEIDSAKVTPASSERRTPWTLLFALLVVAFALRFTYIRQIETPPFSDMADYETMALNLLDGEGLVMNTPHLVYKAYRPPLYPLFIAGVYRTLGISPENVRLVQAVLSTLTVLLVFFIAREVVSGRDPQNESLSRFRSATVVGLIAAGLFAFEESSIFLGGQLLSETLFTFLLVALAYLVLRGSRKPGLGGATLIGILGGCLILTRPLAGPLFLFAVYWFFLRSRKFHPPPPASWKEFSLLDSPYSPPLIALVYAAVIVLSWGIRNQAVLGEFVPVSTNGGVNFYLGHHEGFGYDSFGRKEDIRAALRARGILDEVTEAKVFTHTGLNFIVNNPGQTLINTGKKIDYLFLEPADWRTLFQPWKWWDYLESPYRPWPWETNDRAVRFWPVRDEGGKLRMPTHRDWFWKEGRLPLVFWGWPMVLLTVFGLAVGLGRFKNLSLPVGVVLFYVLALLIFFTNARFRAPIIPFLYLFAAIGVARMFWGLPGPESPAGELATKSDPAEAIENPDQGDGGQPLNPSSEPL